MDCSRKLWVVEWGPGSHPIPIGLSSELERLFDVLILHETSFVLVRADFHALDSVIAQYMYCRIVGEPVDGRWAGSGEGKEVYIVDGDIVPSAMEEKGDPK